MIKTVEAVIDDKGNVHLLESVEIESARRALVLILDEPMGPLNEAALLSERSLAEDWNRAEEDVAWSHLQPGNCSRSIPLLEFVAIETSSGQANAGRQDWILCQVTSKPYGDTRAVLLNDNRFEFNQIIDAVVTLLKSSTNRKNEAPTSTA